METNQKWDYVKRRVCLHWEFLEVNHIVQNDIYVDDCLSGGQNLKDGMIRANQIEMILNRGGSLLKGK